MVNSGTLSNGGDHEFSLFYALPLVRKVTFGDFQGYQLCEKYLCSCSLKGSLKEAGKKKGGVSPVSLQTLLPNLFQRMGRPKKRSQGLWSPAAYTAISIPLHSDSRSSIFNIYQRATI